MARAWAAPQREELRAAGLGAGYIDGMVAIVRREMLEAVYLSFVRTMEGEGDDSEAQVARRIKQGKGVPTFPKVDKATGLPDYEEFQEAALAIAQWVQVEHEGTGESMQGAEIFACSEGLKQANWVRWIARDLQIKVPSVAVLQVDND